MKRRDFRTIHEGTYGPAWERVRLLPCFWLQVDSTHRCELGVTGGHTAHHYVLVSRGGRDRDGLLPCCGAVHDSLHGYGRAIGGSVASRVLYVLGMSVADVALAYSTGDEDGQNLAF